MSIQTENLFQIPGKWLLHLSPTFPRIYWGAEEKEERDQNQCLQDCHKTFSWKVQVLNKNLNLENQLVERERM